MPRIDVPMTRSTLLQTRRSLEFARQAYDLLDRKRQIILIELMGTLDQAERSYAELQERFESAYEELAGARLAMGGNRIRWAGLAIPKDMDVEVIERSVMGVVIPTVQCHVPGFRPVYGLAGTASEMDLTRQAFNSLVDLLCQYAEVQTAIIRLASELQKTQRRVNALKNVVIPREEAIIKAVEEALEEEEREAFIQVKTFKRMKGRSHGNG